MCCLITKPTPILNITSIEPGHNSFNIQQNIAHNKIGPPSLKELVYHHKAIALNNDSCKALEVEVVLKSSENGKRFDVYWVCNVRLTKACC